MYRFELFIPITLKNVELQKQLARKLRVSPDTVINLKIERKSLDSRDKKNIRWIYKILFELTTPLPKLAIKGLSEAAPKDRQVFSRPAGKKIKMVIVGMGPAGIFAAMGGALSGAECVIVERGKTVEERTRDINVFFDTGVLNEESNIQFGEGGAGTFSDGKLMARTKHRYYSFLIDELINAGAPEEIGYLSKPHIGTDRLRKVIINLRKRLIELGVEILFEEKMKSLILDKDRNTKGIVTDKREISSDAVVLATGYSAHDTLNMLKIQDVYMEAKGFAMGYRMELEQDIINKIQYGGHKENLPPAEFFLTTHFPDCKNSVYTFCMCPGGTVIPASSSINSLVLNGMSGYKRNGRFGNAAIVVSYPPHLWHNDAFGGTKIQEGIENQAYAAGGGGYKAPALRVSDFCNRTVSKDLPESSYPRGLIPYPIWEFYEEQYQYFKEAFVAFNHKMKGIISEDALLIAPETRTSSPVRIVRGENYMSVNTPFLFPCGEGAGYAGGIITSAVDGLMAAEKIREIW
jgi:uncharacterized FAD-dependent dehydrogenase